VILGKSIKGVKTDIMEFDIDKLTILPALNFVSQAVVVKSAIPIFKTILISAEKGSVIVRATNNIFDMRYTVPANVKLEGSCCVDSMLVGLLDCFSDDLIHFKKGARLSITQGSRRHQLVYVDPEMFPQLPDISVNYETVDAKSLSRALMCCLGSCLVAGDRPILQTYYINPHTRQIITGDGTRVSLYTDIKVPGNSANPPAKILSSVLLPGIRSLDSETTLEACFGVRSGFRTANWEIFITSLSGEFPAVAGKIILDALHVEPKLTVTFDKLELKNVLRVCSLYANRAYTENKQAQSSMVYEGGNSLRFAMDIVDLSKVDEPIKKFEAKGVDNFEILINPTYLLGVLDNIIADVVEVRFFSNIKPFLVLDRKDPNYVYLQIPLVMPREVELAKQTMMELGGDNLDF